MILKFTEHCLCSAENKLHLTLCKRLIIKMVSSSFSSTYIKQKIVDWSNYHDGTIFCAIRDAPAHISDSYWMQRMMQLFHSQSQILRHDKALTFESMHEILWCDHSCETRSALEYFHMVLFSKCEVSTFESVHEIPWCDHSNVTSSAVHVLSHFIIYYYFLVCSSNFWVCAWILMVWPLIWDLFSRTFTRFYGHSHFWRIFSKAWVLAVMKSRRKKSLKTVGLPIKLSTSAI